MLSELNHLDNKPEKSYHIYAEACLQFYHISVMELFAELVHANSFLQNTPLWMLDSLPLLDKTFIIANPKTVKRKVLVNRLTPGVN